MDFHLNILKQEKDAIFFNSRIEKKQQAFFEKKIEKFFLGKHLWLMSSGTESGRDGKYKFVALSHEAVLAAAKGVCSEFSISSNDVLLNVLPGFHISGLSLAARAYISGAKVVDESLLGWDVTRFVHSLQANKVSVTSLVPTQIFDLVQAKQGAPEKLKVVFAGGGSLDLSLYQKAKTLGWPLIRTYGMTETAAMVAYIPNGESTAKRLPHLTQWQTTDNQRLQFKGPSLLTGFLMIDENSEIWIDPKLDGWYTSDDRGEIDQDRLTLLGRESELVKIKGETVSLVDMNVKWQQWSSSQLLGVNTAIIALPHARDGFELVLISENEVPQTTIDNFNKTLLPFQRLQKTFPNTKIPKTDLGKIKTAELLSSIKIKK
jgi:o-succinylbenzoate---CoA ligase